MIKYLVILSVCLTKLAFGQNAILITDSFKLEQFAKQLVFIEDKSKLKLIDDVLYAKYKPVEQSVPNFGFNNSSYWFKGMIVNSTAKWQSPVIEIANPNLDIVNLYVFSKKTGRHKKLMGDLVPFSARGNNYKYYHFSMQLLPNDTSLFFINVQNSGEQFHVPMSIGTASYFEDFESNEQLIFGVYFGFILFVLLLNGFFYYVLKERANLLYLGYLVCLLFLQLSLTGFGFKYIWPNSVFLANHANPIFASISMFFLLLFAQEFLSTRIFMPKLNKYVNYLKYFLLLVILAAWIDVNAIYVFSVISINVLSMVCIFVIVPASIYILRQKFKPARFFITAFVFLVISVFLFVLKNAGLVPSNPLTNYGLQIGSALEVLLLTLAVIDKFRQFRIDSFNRLQELNDLKTEANLELEKKVEERTNQLNDQKIVLESQNKEILSSIRYAKRIQDSLLPPQEVLDQLFDENYFVYYKPKDIVSGDFYWASPVRTSGEHPIHLSLAAVVDCTGHGVPGAFLSIVASDFLKQSLKEKSVNSTAEALDYLNQKVISNLNQSSNTESRVRDGMDVALIAIDYQKHLLYYSGANNPIYVYRTDEESHLPILHILKPNKQAIGSISDTIQNYDLQIFDVQAGDTIYLFSDGYADQFGGEYNKKLNYKRFKEILAKASEMPMSLQRTFLKEQFESWKGAIEQTDDVCIMGIKI